jgi:glycosyltransferase involved in cell wall biosynthesis
MNSEKNILLFSYYFPPTGMGGVGRALAIYRHLPDFGYNVIVITVKKIVFPHFDSSLLCDINEDSIIRTGSLDPSRLLYKFGFSNKKLINTGSAKTSFFNLPDSKRGWNSFALRAAKRLFRRHKIDAIITTSPPPSTHLIGLKLKRKFNIPWIADFRDPWFSLPIEQVYKTEFQKKYAYRLLNDVRKQADSLVAVNSSIKNCLKKGELITNGADFDYLRFWKRSDDLSDSKLIIGILGTMNRLCPSEPLFKAIAEILRKFPQYKKKLSVIHVGHAAQPEIDLQITKYGLEKMVELKGYQAKNKAIEHLSGCHYLFFSVADTGDYHILPGRIFDYLTSGKPIIGIAPKGSDAARMIEENPHNSLFYTEDTNGLTAYIEQCYDRITRGEYSASEVELRAIDRYSTGHLAKQYANLLNRILDERK